MTMIIIFNVISLLLFYNIIQLSDGLHFWDPEHSRQMVNYLFKFEKNEERDGSMPEDNGHKHKESVRVNERVSNE